MKMADTGTKAAAAQQPVAMPPAIPAPIADAPTPTLLASASKPADSGHPVVKPAPAAQKITAEKPVLQKAPVPAVPLAVAVPATPPASVATKPVIPAPRTARDMSVLPSVRAHYAAIGMAPPNTQGQTDLPAPVDHSWNAQGSVTTGYKRLDGISNADLNARATAFLRDMKTQCDGPFIAEASTPRIDPARKTGWVVAEAACAPRDGRDTVSAVAFVNAPDALTVYVFHADAENGASAITARDALITQIMK
jgi:hypothetical protein